MLGAASLTIWSLPEEGGNKKCRLIEPRLMRQVVQWEHDCTGRRALVLFRYWSQRYIHEERVYNATTAWPDDARIIRAQDLGPQNHKLFEYYAKIQPDREVFLFDEESRTYQELGTVARLAK